MKVIFNILLIGLLLSACATHHSMSANDVSDAEVWGASENVTKFHHLYFSEQPNAETLSIAKAKGVKTVINLRDPSEMNWDEETEAKKLGLNYVNIPVSKESDSFSSEAVAAIEAAVKGSHGEPVFLHCSSGNRAAGWLAIHLIEAHELPRDDALAIARKSGLTSGKIEARVNSYLDSPKITKTHSDTHVDHSDKSHMYGAHGALPLPQRLAFMTGHVEAGLALYRAGEPKMAAKHLLHPVSETHADERVGLEALGFDASLFVTVSDALDAGIPANEIEPQLAAAQANLAMVAKRAGGDRKEIIAYLLDTVVEEYRVGVNNGVVTDMGEYQDAFGFVTVALYQASYLQGQNGENVRTQLQSLLSAWPKAPVPPMQPSSFERIEALVNAVRTALNT